ncbi:YciI family protein [Glycomyces albus]
MFVVLLRFSDNKAAAGQHMDGHRRWISNGLDDGVFLLAGSIQPGLGGAVLAHNVSPAELDKRVAEDPFVAEGVVTAEIIEIAPGMVDERLGFLL